MGGQVRYEETQPRAHVVGDRVLHTRGRRQHWVNKENGGAVLLARTVDVQSHSYGIDMNTRELLGWFKFNRRGRVNVCSPR